MYDLLISNAKLLDVDTGKISENNSVAVKGERIAKIFTDDKNISARTVIDAGGKFLFPGFIDFHVHVFKHGSTFGLDANDLIPSGITCAVDMGSAGWMNFPAMYMCDIIGKKPRLKTYINISPVGQPGKGVNEPLDDDLLSVEEISRVINEFPGMICGLKVRISKGIVKELGIKPLINAVKMGEALNLRVCVHTTNPPVSMPEVVKILRAGDIFSHTFNGKGMTIIDEHGQVHEEIIDAQKRGVIFEVGNGRMNFNFQIAEAAAKNNFWPDVISSDATPATYHNGPIMWDLSRVISKFLNLGMPLEKAIKAATETPAKIIGADDFIGKIREGYCADLTLCRFDDSVIEFSDVDGNSRRGKMGIVPEVVILKGQKVFG